MANFRRVFILTYLTYLLIIINNLYTLFRLETIHKANFIHRDFHSGNILSSLTNEEVGDERHQWQIGDLGLSQPVDKPSSNDEIYGEKKKKESLLKIIF
jgi:serine/threonine protein kinase